MKKKTYLRRNLPNNSTTMARQYLSDKQIVDGFRQGNSRIIRDYFYDYCRTAYAVYDQRYELSKKQNMDFMSLAHQYALYLMEHQWQPLDDKPDEVSLRTWVVGGFRFTVLDALKWYQREYGSISYEDYLRTFDTSRDLRLQFNRTIQDLCALQLDRQERVLVNMLLVQGYKIKEVAQLTGVTPSAVTQRFNHIKQRVIIPYFRQHFDLDFEDSELLDDADLMMLTREEPAGYARHSRFNLCYGSMPTMRPMPTDDSQPQEPTTMEQKRRTTPTFITHLNPNEIFVFGSNLRGMHGGGAAYVAYRRFGAIMGQGTGLQGQSYAIPTMQGGVDTIRPYVDEFISFAKEHPELTFLVTRIGCGIAGFTDADIAPLFSQAHDVPNIVLPEGW